MATLVKIKGLDRGDSAVASGSVGPARGFRVRSGLGQQFPSGVKASRTSGTSNAAVTSTARYGGTYGNSIKVAYVASGTAGDVAVTYSGSAPTITVSLGSGSTLSATNAAAAINADPEASSLVTATAGGTGASNVVAEAATALSGGTNVGTGQAIYKTVNNKSVTVVDADDAETARILRRNSGRYISLGQA